MKADLFPAPPDSLLFFVAAEDFLDVELPESRVFLVTPADRELWLPAFLFRGNFRLPPLDFDDDREALVLAL